MLLGFKRRFSEFVEQGSKTHTIRANRKYPPRVGQTCHCYTGLRQKGARLLGRWVCTKVEPILIYECGDHRFSVVVAGEQLTPDEKDMLAWRDGFREGGKVEGSFIHMVRYWVQEHGDGRIVDVDYTNFRQGEPWVRPGTQPGRRVLKSVSFEGVIIHWAYTQAGRAQTAVAHA